MKQSFLLFILVCFQATAQNITGKIIDSQTGESIPYANIMAGDANLVSNAEGFFTLPERSSGDDVKLTVSYLGYMNAQTSVGALKNGSHTIKLEPAILQLDNINVSNVKPDPNKIMAMVKANLQNNYKTNGQPAKDVMFLRESNYFKPAVLDLVIDKSSGFTKNNLKSANTELTAFTSRLIKQPPQEFTDMLCNYYTATVKKTDKAVAQSKLEVVKATKLRNENSSASFDEMQKTATNIVLKHLDSTKYYRIKSGLFGSHDTISLRKDYSSKKNKKPKNTHLTSSKTNLSSFLFENNFTQSLKLDFVRNSELYEYEYEGAIYSSDQEFVYVLNFKPRKSKAKYTGKLYISETDYAVLRADYDLGEGKKVSGFNMKWILGVKASENVSKGTVIYKKDPIGDGYYLQYASQESGQYFYINRPLKFIELTKEEKDVVAFDIKVEGSSRDKTEFLNISRSEVSEATIEELKEADFNYVTLKSYDPKIWKDHSAIEPLEEMKQFRATN